MIYTEEVRDRLDDPLATNFKYRRKSFVLENRCQFLIPLNSELEEYKLIGMKKAHFSLSVLPGRSGLYDHEASFCCCCIGMLRMRFTV